MGSHVSPDLAQPLANAHGTQPVSCHMRKRRPPCGRIHRACHPSTAPQHAVTRLVSGHTRVHQDLLTYFGPLPQLAQAKLVPDAPQLLETEIDTLRVHAGAHTDGAGSFILAAGAGDSKRLEQPGC